MYSISGGKKMKIKVDINLKDLAHDLCNEMNENDLCNEMNENALFNLITDIDFGIADWDFTERIYKYFREEIKNKK
jgi:hypothetical protein